MVDKTPIYIGIDAGGSKTELLAAHEQSDELLNLFGASGNPARVGFDGSIDVLSELIFQATERLPHGAVTSVCAGVAGAGRERDQHRIREGIMNELGDRAPHRLRITHDGDIALEAAFEGRSGIMVIAGTGSVTLARTRDGAFLRAGGWGYLIGDEGSGYALGAGGLRALAHAFDGGPDTAISELLAASRDVATPDDLNELVYQKKVPLQKFAPLVIQAARDGDAIAREILSRETRGLAQQVRWLADRCPSVRPRVALLGGVTNEPTYREALRDALLEVLPDWKMTEPLNRPVVGAWRMARTLSGA
ncbi:MAG: BadF/BadG/BcrA/BcrD ATPase family protein [Rhodothermales bacterium]